MDKKPKGRTGSTDKNRQEIAFKKPLKHLRTEGKKERNSLMKPTLGVSGEPFPESRK